MQHAKSVAGSATKDSLKKHLMEPAEFAAAEARIRPLVEAATAETYDKAVAAGKTVKQARDDATKVGRDLARNEALAVGKKVAAEKGMRAIASGTAFDSSKMDAAARAQLATSQTSIMEAHRLAPKLSGKTEAEFLSLMAEEVSTGRVPPPRTLSIGGPPPQPMTMWEYVDGTTVRYKPSGDRYRTSPSFSVEVKAHPGLPDTGPESAAFKLDSQGRAAPKSDFQILNPYSKKSHEPQFSAFEDAIMDAVHFGLK